MTNDDLRVDRPTLALRDARRAPHPRRIARTALALWLTGAGLAGCGSGGGTPATDGAAVAAPEATASGVTPSAAPQAPLSAAPVAKPIAGDDAAADPTAAGAGSLAAVSPVPPAVPTLGATAPATKPASPVDASAAASDAPRSAGAAPPAADAADALDERMVSWATPRRDWAQQPGVAAWWQQATAPAGPIAAIPEPGLLAPNGDYALQRTRDPDASARAAFRHRVWPSLPLADGSARAELALHPQAPTGEAGALAVDHTYWLGHAVRLDADALDAGRALELMRLEPVPPTVAAPTASIAATDAALAPLRLVVEAGRLRIERLARTPGPADPGAATAAASGAPAGTGAAAERASSYVVLADLPASAGVWYELVLQLRLSESAGGGMARIWLRDAQTGVTTLVADDAGALSSGPRIAAYAPVFGLAAEREGAWAPAASSATSHTKGLLALEARPGTAPVDEATIYALLDAI